MLGLGFTVRRSCRCATSPFRFQPPTRRVLPRRRKIDYVAGKNLSTYTSRPGVSMLTMRTHLQVNMGVDKNAGPRPSRDPASFFWSRQRESNPQPTVYKTVALPLSHAGVRSYMIAGRASGEKLVLLARQRFAVIWGKLALLTRRRFAAIWGKLVLLARRRFAAICEVLGNRAPRAREKPYSRGERHLLGRTLYVLTPKCRPSTGCGQQLLYKSLQF